MRARDVFAAGIHPRVDKYLTAVLHASTVIILYITCARATPARVRGKVYNIKIYKRISGLLHPWKGPSAVPIYAVAGTGCCRSRSFWTAADDVVERRSIFKKTASEYLYTSTFILYVYTLSYYITSPRRVHGPVTGVSLFFLRISFAAAPILFYKKL